MTTILFSEPATPVTDMSGNSADLGSVTVLKDGSYIVTFSLYDITLGENIYQRHFAADGTALGAATQVNVSATRGPSGINSTALNDGGYVVFWAVVGEDMHANIFQQRFNAAGAKIGGEVKVNSLDAIAPYWYLQPQVTNLSDGGYIVTYGGTNAAGTYQVVMMQRFNATGAKVGVEIPLDPPVAYDTFQQQPHVAALAGGGYVVTWQGFNNGGLYGQLFTTDGAETGGQFFIDSRSDYPLPIVNPEVVGLAGGGFVVTWAEGGSEFHRGHDVYYARFAADGSKLTQDILVSTRNGDKTAPKVVSLADGGYVIAWSAEGTSDNYYSAVYTQRFDAEGNRVGEEILVNARYDTTYSDSAESLAPTPDGGYIIVWGHYELLASAAQLVQRIYAPDVLRPVSGDDGANLIDGDYHSNEIFGLGGNDTLNGNDGNDVLRGAAGDDILNTGTGLDTVDGGAGIDKLTLDRSGTGLGLTIDMAQAETATGLTLADGTLVRNVETLGQVRTGTGNDTFILTSNTAVFDSLDAGAGTDTLVIDYGGVTSDVVMSYVGGAGDTFSFGARGSVSRFEYFSIVSGAGNDLLIGTSNADTLEGSAGNDTIQAGFGDDTVRGGDGSDALNGGNGGRDWLDGGVGADTMSGGTGNDTYVVDDAGDVVVEVSSLIAMDLVLASVSYVLSEWVDNLTLTGSGDINATGNTLANSLTGNDGANRLDGGAGADWMNGGVGSDTYYVDNANDVVFDYDGDFINLVIASVSYDMNSGSAENLSLTGTADLDAAGNYFDNGLTGNAGNNRLDGGIGADTLAGGGGDDTYVVDDLLDQVTEAEGDGTDTVLAAMSFGLAANVENLTLTGTGAFDGWGNALGNLLTGNSAANVLTGLQGDDTYVIDAADTVVEAGGGGNDTVLAGFSYTLMVDIENLTLTGDAAINGTGNGAANLLRGNSAANILIGLAGDDSYYIEQTGDNVIEAAGQGADSVYAGLNYVLTSHVERLYLTGSANIAGTGNDLANDIHGNGGNNRLDGGLGADTMAGSLGNDSFVVDNAADVVTEMAGEGTDLVQSSVRFTLGNNIERLILSGAGNIAGTGNGLDNGLTGNAGNNRLDGGLGADTMAGGAGDDNFVVDDAGDRVFENAGEGNDSVAAGFSYSLGTQYVENLTLTGANDLTAIGNALANTLIGNAGNNVLNGGTGIDNLWGGAGNDTYHVDNISDRTFEKTTASTDAGGHDVVYASVRVTLDQFVEDLVITGTSSLAGTGNALNNILTGNGGSNALLGKDGNDVLNGGAGADIMAGGTGNDTYHVDNIFDRVAEASNQGVDTIYSSVSFNIGNQFVETLILTGEAAVNATGNAVANALLGNDAANILDGGKGSDTIQGRGGADVFMIGLQSGADIITDFSAAQGDSINLHAYAQGQVNGGGIVIAQDGADTVITLGGGNVVTVSGVLTADVAVHIVW